jgi:hypothetical protein
MDRAVDTPVTRPGGRAVLWVGVVLAIATLVVLVALAVAAALD